MSALTTTKKLRVPDSINILGAVIVIALVLAAFIYLVEK